MTHARDTSFLDNLPGAVIVSDSATRVLYANRTAEDILKISREHLKGMKLLDRVYPADRKKVGHYAETLRRARHMVTQRRFRNGDGTYVVIERNTQLLKDGSQLSICRLVTDERISEKKDTFASMAGHELRNPLAGIQLNLDLLTAQFESDTNATHIKMLLDNTQHYVDLQNRMIENLLHFSQLRKGKLLLHTERFEPRPFLENILRQIRMTSQRIFTLTIAKDVPRFITADTDQMYQVCINVLSNAVKFSKPPTPIDIRVSRVHDMCEIAITDHGVGIRKNHINSIFKDFFQIKPSEVSGLGIGLYLAHEIVELHKGKILVESDGLGQGSTFKIHLPLHMHK